MQIAAIYSFNRGKEEVTRRYRKLFPEVNEAIKEVDSSQHKTKKSTEKTMPGRMLFSPRGLNDAFKASLIQKRDWQVVRVPCDYPENYYVEGYKCQSYCRGAFREMDFVKQKLGIEVQFGKYAFMVYNVCAR